MPAKSATRSVTLSDKPKRTTRKPASFVPGATNSISKKKTKATGKRKATATKTKTTRRKPKATKSTTKASKTKKAVKTTLRAKAKKATPKKTTPKKTATKTASKATGQLKYEEMVVASIKALRKRLGSSRQAITAYIKNNFHSTPSTRFIRDALAKVVRTGKVEKIRASYRMTPKTPAAVKKTGPKKTITKKTTTKKVKKVATKAKGSQASTPKRGRKKAAPAAASDSTAPSESEPIIWQFLHGTWQNYAPEASALVEEQYQDWLNNSQMFDVRAVKSGAWEYNVDFRNMEQQNIQHENHTKRPIRRYAYATH